MTNRPDHVNHPEAVQLPITLHVDTVSIVLMISRSNHLNGDAMNDATTNETKNTHIQNILNTVILSKSIHTHRRGAHTLAQQINLSHNVYAKLMRFRLNVNKMKLR